MFSTANRLRAFGPTVLFVALVMTAAPTTSWGQDESDVTSICKYPRRAPREPFSSRRPAFLRAAGEQEPNDDFARSQAVPLGFGAGQDRDVDITDGEIKILDKDFYTFDAQKGDVLGAACLSGNFDSILTVFDADGNVMLENDNHSGPGDIGGIASLYPLSSELPGGGIYWDPVLSFVFPKSGWYHVRVRGNGASSGEYLLQLRLRRPAMREAALGQKQIVLVDFTGPTIDAKAIFGEEGKVDAKLSPMRDFLSRWGLGMDQEDAVIESTMRHLRARFDQLRKSDYNGDFATTNRGGDYDVEFRDSRQGSAAFGQPYVSRVIVGGTIAESGLKTIGLAQYVDPGNVAHEDTAIVLLDLLSAPSNSPEAPNSINAFTLGMGVTKVDAVGHVLAAVIAHEFGHLVGCWHTSRTNSVASLMDQGGNLRNTAGVGSDGILDQGDIVDFLPDVYAREGIGAPSNTENVPTWIAFGLSTGTLSREGAVLALERDLLQAREERARFAAGGKSAPSTYRATSSLLGNLRRSNQLTEMFRNDDLIDFNDIQIGNDAQLLLDIERPAIPGQSTSGQGRRENLDREIDRINARLEAAKRSK